LNGDGGVEVSGVRHGQPVGRVRKRGDVCLDLPVDLGDIGLDGLHPLQHLGQQKRVVVGERPTNASSNTGILRRRLERPEVVRANCVKVLRTPATPG
jgi:hypothetical protein